MRLGVVFPQTELGGDVGAVRAYGQAVGELGYRHVLAYDHVLGADPAVHTGWAGPYDVTTTFHEPLVMFGYLAAVTDLELVTGVIILPSARRPWPPSRPRRSTSSPGDASASASASGGTRSSTRRSASASTDAAAVSTSRSSCSGRSGRRRRSRSTGTFDVVHRCRSRAHADPAADPDLGRRISPTRRTAASAASPTGGSRRSGRGGPRPCARDHRRGRGSRRAIPERIGMEGRVPVGRRRPRSVRPSGRALAGRSVRHTSPSTRCARAKPPWTTTSRRSSSPRPLREFADRSQPWSGREDGVQQRGLAIRSHLPAVVDRREARDKAVGVELDGGDADQAVAGGPLEAASMRSADDVAERAPAPVRAARRRPGRGRPLLSIRPTTRARIVMSSSTTSVWSRAAAASASPSASACCSAVAAATSSGRPGTGRRRP